LHHNSGLLVQSLNMTHNARSQIVLLFITITTDFDNKVYPHKCSNYVITGRQKFSRK